eukprot:8886256-Pyramimonas_sp.AAC.1
MSLVVDLSKPNVQGGCQLIAQRLTLAHLKAVSDLDVQNVRRHHEVLESVGQDALDRRGTGVATYFACSE